MKDAKLKRGVWAVRNGFPGTTVLRVIDRNGGQLMRVEVVNELCDEPFVGHLEEWLEMLDPVAQLLQII